jgi:hypothetical protein
MAEQEQLDAKPKGFARMSKDGLREIARKGGVAAHAQGKAHQWTREEAREAGKKGGAATAALRTTKKGAET